MTQLQPNRPVRKSNRDAALAAVLVMVFFAMLGASYAAVPLYKLICNATGLNGTTQRVDGSRAGTILPRLMTVHFDANTGAAMPWQFKPKAESVTVHIGQTVMAYFVAYNPTSRDITGSATFNVTPEITGRYFDKIQCFCFNAQTLKAGERVEMPVTFYIDPDIVKEADANNISDITLSYTFYETAKVPAASANAGAAGPGVTGASALPGGTSAPVAKSKGT